MHRFPLLALALAFVLAACGDRGPVLDPPEGWQTDGDARWWRADADPDRAFRDLSGFETMGLSEREDGLRPESPTVRNVQRRFLPIYRNHPEAVDSVFGAAIVPLVNREASPADDEATRERLISQANRRLHQAFYPAQGRPREAAAIVIPDSLRETVAGRVLLQIYLDAEGLPAAIERLEGVHPTVDALVMRNFAERTWQPAHLNGRPVASWVRTDLNIGQ
jgi:predicted small lipoprotein YifL